MIEEKKLREAVQAEFDARLEMPPLGKQVSGFLSLSPKRPYRGVLPAWLSDAASRAAAGETVVCLIPARTDTGWWWDYARRGEVRFLHSRVRFGGQKSGAPFPSAVVRFGPDAKVGRTWLWDVNTGELHELDVTYGHGEGTETA
jgi:hypothetical protein